MSSSDLAPMARFLVGSGSLPLQTDTLFTPDLKEDRSFSLSSSGPVYLCSFSNLGFSVDASAIGEYQSQYESLPSTAMYE